MSSSTPFNTLGGYSVGIPPKLIIDNKGNLVNNVNAPNSNVTANRVFANGFFYANGSPLSIGASGSNTQVQYNNAGLLGASSAFTFNSTTSLLTVSKIQVSNNANLGNISNVIILGGLNGYFLQTDGQGNLTWAPGSNSSNAGNGVPGGANTQVQFNDEGQFGGVAGFTFNKSNLLLNVGNLNANVINANNIALTQNLTSNNVVANFVYGNGFNITDVRANIANTANSVAGANVTGQVNFANVANNVAGANVTGQVNFANVANNVAASNISGQVANALIASTVYSSAQANITSLGNLTSLTVVGNTTLGNQVVANNFIGNLFGLANLARNVTLAAQPNITSVGTLTSLTVSGNTTLGNSVTANYFIGNLYGVANSATIANVANVATLANTATLANAANLAGTVTVNAQPNITSVGTLSSLNVTGNITSGNANLGNLITANFVAGTLTTSAQPNITSIGTLTGLTVNGNLSATNLSGNGSNLTNIQGANVVGVVPTANVAYNANLANTVAVANQPNITSVGTLTSLTVNGVSNLGAVGNVIITGGVNGYVLSTDGSGNLSWVVQSNGGGGNGLPAGSNTQLQFNNSGSFGASPNLTYNSTTNLLFVGGNATISGTANLSTLNSNVINSNTLNVTSNVIAGNISGANLVSANYLAGQLTTSSQNNIHYLGNIGSLNVDTDIPGANGNITFDGTLLGLGIASNIQITGNINAANYVEANYLIGELTTTAQPNITSLGTLTSLTISGITNLGNVGNVKIQGGNANYVLSTDGTGNLTWVEQEANAVTPGGLNTYIQFNDNGQFGGDNTLTWNKNTDSLFVGGNANIASVVTAQIFNSNIATGSAPLTVVSTTPVANLGVQTAATVRDSSQSNITSLGTLTSLNVSGNTTTSNLSVTSTFSVANITTPGTIGTTNLNVTGLANFSSNAYVHSGGVLFVNGNINSNGSANVNLGNISNIHIYGGLNGYVLSTDGAGNLSWAVGGGGGGNGTPGGSNTQIQFNSNGTFGGSSTFTFDESTKIVRLAGNLQTNAFVLGSGIYEFSRSNVYFATTSDTSTYTLLSIPAEDIAAVDYTIISTEGNIRNFTKISTVRINETLNYVEYSTLPVGGYTGDFVIQYNSGNILSPPSIDLNITPQTANLTTYKMSVTTYKE